jgi:hypothetical protein
VLPVVVYWLKIAAEVDGHFSNTTHACSNTIAHLLCRRCRRHAIKALDLSVKPASPLGLVPHQIRGYLSHHRTLVGG